MSGQKTYLIRLSRIVTQEGFTIVKAESAEEARRQVEPDLSRPSYGSLPVNWGDPRWAEAMAGEVEEVKGR